MVPGFRLTFLTARYLHPNGLTAFHLLPSAFCYTINSMEIVLLIAALLVAILVFTWMVRVVKATVTTALTIAVIVLALQLLFGIDSQDLFRTLSGLWRGLWQIVLGGS